MMDKEAQQRKQEELEKMKAAHKERADALLETEIEFEQLGQKKRMIDNEYSKLELAVKAKRAELAEERKQLAIKMMEV